MSNALPDSITDIVDRILRYLKDDEAIDMVYLNNELVSLNECIEHTGIRKLGVNEIGALLHGIKIIESQLKSLGLVSHLLKNMKDSIYNKSI
ncbi:MAG TPA: hypothetical protein VKQ08_01125 [Cyclobacteriaceae bacterium]|nr:hypothetical protein [Cyclobacteriaceae bacterium]